MLALSYMLLHNPSTIVRVQHNWMKWRYQKHLKHSFQHFQTKHFVHTTAAMKNKSSNPPQFISLVKVSLHKFRSPKSPTSVTSLKIIHHNTQTIKQTTDFCKSLDKLKELYISPVAHCKQTSSATCMMKTIKTDSKQSRSWYSNE